jgi:hypothetical protein
MILKIDRRIAARDTRLLYDTPAIYWRSSVPHTYSYNTLLPGNKFFNAAFEGAPCQQDATAALKAFYTDISSQPDNLPFETAARMDFFQPDYISKINVHNLLLGLSFKPLSRPGPD